MIFNKKGFSLVETLIAILIIAIAFYPLLQMFTVPLATIEDTSAKTTARYIGMYYIEYIKNFYSKQAIWDWYNTTGTGIRLIIPEPTDPISPEPMVMNDRLWRTEIILQDSALVDAVPPNTALLDVTVNVYEIEAGLPSNDEDFLNHNPVFSINTLIEDY